MIQSFENDADVEGAAAELFSRQTYEMQRAGKMRIPAASETSTRN